MAAPAAVKVAQIAATRRGRGAIAAAVIGGFIGVLLLLLVFAALLGALLRGETDSRPTTPPAAGAAPASAEALSEIPSDYLRLYAQAGGQYGIDWAVLAGVGKAECDHGRSQLAGCDPPGTVNRAGARGPMQFLGSTWRSTAGTFDVDVSGQPIPQGQESHGYATDGNLNGAADPWEPADAIHAAARLLARNGAPDDYEAAVYGYNHSDTYVSDVLDQASRYRADPDDPTAFEGSSGEVPLLTVECPGGGSTEVHAQLMPVIEALYAQAPESLCGGGYRDPADQIELRRQHCGTSDYAIYDMPSSQCTPPTARPGSSQHEVGLAIDLTCNGTLIRTRTDPCWAWLNEHATDYGLHELPSEPWHWSVNGR